MTFKDLQKLVQSQASLEQNQLVTRLKDKQFWIWNIEQHKQEDIKTKGDCCLNHVIGLPRKDGIEKSIFDIPKLKRLGKVYDLAVMVKVVEGDTTAEDDNSNMGADMTDWTDLGIGRNIAASTNEPEEISETQISERGDTPGNDPTSHIHVSKAANPTPAAGQDNDDAATKLRDYERLSKKSQEHSKAAANVGEV